MKVHFTKNGQPYVLKPSGRAMFISKEKASQMGAMKSRKKGKPKKRSTAEAYKKKRRS